MPVVVTREGGGFVVVPGTGPTAPG
jgi:hypothetical protein